MSGGVSTFGLTAFQINRIKTMQTQIADLSYQVSSGKKAQEFQELGTDTLFSVRARADLRSLEVYQRNITVGKRHVEEKLNTLSQIQAQLENVSGSLKFTANQGEFPELETIQRLAGNVRNTLIEMANSRDGESYLFSGADASSPPLRDTGVYDSFLGSYVPDESNLLNPPLTASGLIGQWGNGTITTDQFIDSYRNVSETTLEYSAALTNNEAGRNFIRADDELEFDITTLADMDGIKNAIRGLGVLENLPPPQYAPGSLNDPAANTFAEDTAPFPPQEKQENFYAVIEDISVLIRESIDDLRREQEILAQQVIRIDQISESHEREIIIQEDILGDIEDADVAEAATRLNQVRFQLEASFNVTAIMGELNLSRFL